MANGQILQDSFLDKLEKEQMDVSIFLVNGIKLHGTVEYFDQDVVMLKSVITQMIYKHAISTIVPSEAVELDA